jgi:glycosyltransferase involved in cell wall biosynthesis
VSIILMGGGGEDLLNGISGLNVLRTGFVDGAADAAALYAAADLFVCPSLQDNLPNTLLEASACGTPSLVFDAAGSPETVENDVTGRIVRAGDAQAMGDAMADLIGDPASLSRMGAAARTRAEKLYGDDRMAADYRALYEELIASRETA